MLVQKFFKLIGIKIRQHLIAGYECRHIGLRRELGHFRIRLSIFADIDLDEFVAALREKIFRINAPRAPFATVKLQLHRQAEINKRFQPRQQSRS